MEGKILLNNKKRYEEWCMKNYVPIFSKPFWLDAVCGQDSWDVWLYESGNNIIAAMPYYMEDRNGFRYITKAPLTQNNGILFEKDERRKAVTNAELQEKVINDACDFIESLELDVYEQQFHYSFDNWSPFYWRHYTALLRYTYVIEDTSDMDAVFNEFTANYRKNIRKGQRLTFISDDIDLDTFYSEHGKIFEKQGLKPPIPYNLWMRLYIAVQAENCGKLICAKDGKGNIHSLMYVIWDEQALYPILGGYMPEYSNSQSYPALTYHSIEMAHDKGIKYDFEGSMIKQIARSFRQFGGKPMPYYRIRKIFNPKIVRQEAEEYISLVCQEKIRMGLDG